MHSLSHHLILIPAPAPASAPAPAHPVSRMRKTGTASCHIARRGLLLAL